MIYKVLLVVYTFVFLLDAINCYGDDYGDYGPVYFSKGARVLTGKDNKQNKGVSKRAKYEEERSEYRKHKKVYIGGGDDDGGSGDDEGQLIKSNSGKGKGSQNPDETSGASNFGDNDGTDKGGNDKKPPKGDEHTSDGSGGHTSDGSGGHTSDGSGDHSSDGSGDHSSDGSGDRSSDGSGGHTSDGSGDHSSDGSGDHTSDGSGDHSSDGSGDHTSDDSGQNKKPSKMKGLFKKKNPSKSKGSDKDGEKEEGALKAIGRSAYEGLTRFGKGAIGVHADFTEDLEDKSHKRFGGKVKSYNSWGGNSRYDRYPSRLYPRRHRYRSPFRNLPEFERHYEQGYGGYPGAQRRRNRPSRRERVSFFVSTKELHGRPTGMVSSTSEPHINDEQSSEEAVSPEMQSSEEPKAVPYAELNVENNDETNDETHTEHNEEPNAEPNDEHNEETNDELNDEHNDEPNVGPFAELNFEPSDELTEMDDNTIDGEETGHEVVRSWHSSSSSQSKWDGAQMRTQQKGRKAGFGWDRHGDKTKGFEFDYSY